MEGRRWTICRGFVVRVSSALTTGSAGAKTFQYVVAMGRTSGRRMLRCRSYKARFPERQGTPLFGSTLSEQKVRSVLEHIAEGCGACKTSRLVGVYPDLTP